MGQFNSTLVQDGRLLPGIHGLRGIAAIAVVFFHLVHVGGLNPPTSFQFIGRDFGYGVHLFHTQRILVDAFNRIADDRAKLAK